MDIFESRYYKSCKVLMEVLGLWPYQNQSTRRMCYFFFYVLHCSILIPQIIILTHERDFHIIIENTISIMFLCASIIKYSVSFMSASRYHLLFKQIANDWQQVTDQNEREILSRYGEEGRFLVIFYTVYVFWAWATYNMLPFLPPILDIVLPKSNGSHPILLPFYADYILFKQLDYHYQTCIHALCVYFFTTTLFAGIDTIYVASVKHSCGLFAVTCYRLESMAKSKKQNQSAIELKLKAIVHRDLAKAITLHNKTIYCCSLLEDSFSTCFLIIQTLCVITIAVVSFYILFVYNDSYKLLRVSAFFMGTLIHLLYLHWVGQQIIDSSEKVFNSAYFGEWYLISTNARKMTEIIMIRSLQPCILSAGKISSLSMQTFGGLMKTSMSYFTVLLSMT